MICRSNFAHRSPYQPSPASGYTLVEILVALVLTLILMTAVVKVFGDVGPSISNARKALEQFDRQRTVGQQLGQDLNNMTARLDGRAGRSEEALGYAEFVEGSYLFYNAPATAGQPSYYAINAKTNQPDYSVGERGDFIQFTARNAARPYVGRYNPTGSAPQTVQSDVAEIAWFLRGNHLHRRVLLVVPGAAQALAAYPNKANYYNDNDISARIVTANGKFQIVPNSLADLTKREYRFGHNAGGGFPYDVRGWGTLGLPTLAECTLPTFMANWTAGSTPPPPAPSSLPPPKVDLWDNSANGAMNTTYSDQALSSGTATRVSDDVVLTNVIGFDIKVWEPAANNGAGGYVDLGSNESGVSNQAQNQAVYLTPAKTPAFQPPWGPNYYRFINGGIVESGLSGSGSQARIYDTGCFAYANELGYSQATNGMNDGPPVPPGYAIVDNLTEYLMTSGPLAGYAPGVPPYPVPLRGIQIKIRCFEPDSKQIREITIEHDFLPK